MNTDIKVRENAKSWTVKKTMDKIKITYNISKEICEDRKSLEKYLKKEGIA